MLLSGTSTARPLPADVGETFASVFLSESTDQCSVGQPVSFVAHVNSSQNADGCVIDFVDNRAGGAVVIGSQTVSNGAASFTWSGGVTGSHEIFAQLEAGQAVAGTASAPQTLTIGKASTSTALVQVGAMLVATISVNGAPASGGSVSFFEGTTLLGTVQVRADGTAPLPVSVLRAGTHGIVAAYNGSSQLLPSISGELMVVVGGTPHAVVSHPVIVPHGRGVWALPVELPAVKKAIAGGEGGGRILTESSILDYMNLSTKQAELRTAALRAAAYASGKIPLRVRK